MQGASQYKPPRVDVNCPDLYIPAMGLWTYALVVAAAQAAKGKFKPDNMYALVRRVWGARGRGGGAEEEGTGRIGQLVGGRRRLTRTCMYP